MHANSSRGHAEDKAVPSSHTWPSAQTEPTDLPHFREIETLAALKRYEDTLDALVCAWVGMQFANGLAIPYGDESAAIWVAKSG